MANLTPAQVAGVASAAGFSGANLTMAVAVSMAEDEDGDPAAVNVNTDGSRDRGLWQINDRAHPDVLDAQAFDPAGCAQAAYAISSSGTDWTPWAKYTSDAYQANLAAASKAAGSPVAPDYTPGTLDPTTTVAVSTPARPITDGVDLYSKANTAKYTGPATALTTLALNGSKLHDDVLGKVTDATLTHTIDGADTVTIVFADADRALLNSPALQARSLCQVRGRWYQLVQVSTSGTQTTTTFEDLVTSRLRGQWGLITVPAGQTTRPAFIQRLCAEAHVHCRVQTDERVDPTPGDANDTGADEQTTTDVALLLTGKASSTATSRRGLVVSKTALTRGTSDNPNETSWDAIQRLVGALGWRAYSDGLTLWAGSDSWIRSQHGKAISLQENVNGIGWLSGDYDLAKVQGNDATFTTVEDFTTAIGTGATVTKAGLLGGNWLVRTVVRRAFSTQCTVTLTRAQGDLAEPADTSTVASGAGGLPADGSAVKSGTVAATVVAFGQSKLGSPYATGGTGPAYDCSGLAMEAYAAAGISIPRATYAQWSALPPVDFASAQPGDLIYFDPDSNGLPGHVGIYIGNGQMIDAPNPNAVVREESVSGFGTCMGLRRPTK